MSDTSGYDLSGVRKNGRSRRLRRVLTNFALRADAELVDQLVGALRLFHEEENDDGGVLLHPRGRAACVAHRGRVGAHGEERRAARQGPGWSA